jgi:hypothetical protein
MNNTHSENFHQKRGLNKIFASNLDIQTSGTFGGVVINQDLFNSESETQDENSIHQRLSYGNIKNSI